MQLFQLTLSGNPRDKTARCYRKYCDKFIRCSFCSPLHNISHTGKFLSYFHPSYGIYNFKIIAESQKIFSSRLYNPTTLIEMDVYRRSPEDIRISQGRIEVHFRFFSFFLLLITKTFLFRDIVYRKKRKRLLERGPK